MCERILEEEGVYGDVRIGEFHLSLLALDWDLLSLENPDAFKELFVVASWFNIISFGYLNGFMIRMGIRNSCIILLWLWFVFKVYWGSYRNSTERVITAKPLCN